MDLGGDDPASKGGREYGEKCDESTEDGGVSLDLTE